MDEPRGCRESGPDLSPLRGRHGFFRRPENPSRPAGISVATTEKLANHIASAAGSTSSSGACSGEARHDDVKAQAPRFVLARFAALPVLQIVEVKEGPFGSRAFDEDIKAEEAQGGGKSASQEIASRASDSTDRP